jgi:hypothetical protein
VSEPNTFTQMIDLYNELGNIKQHGDGESYSRRQRVRGARYCNSLAQGCWRSVDPAAIHGDHKGCHATA